MSTETSETSTAPDQGLDHLSDHYDVAIMGGGITGLTLALELSQNMPDLRIVVAEKKAHPVPPAAHKVGESSVEVQGHYLRTVLGLNEHLESAQLNKFGLRMFFTQGDNSDITHRVEYGQTEHAPLASYQLDRGRLENMLGEKISADADFVSGCSGTDVTLGEGDTDHTVLLRRGAASKEITARWLVDATGRSSMLKRKLGLARGVGHQANSSWFRIDHKVDVNGWSDDEAWIGRIPTGERRLSTNHMMGDGYWVWIIPLAGDATSVGIVAEANTHPFESFNRLDRALDWLREHEPQLAAEVEANREKILDFRVMKDYAYSCEKVYSEDRWCLTGEAGVSIDPLYSSGGDLMAISNGFITDLVRKDRAGEDIEDATAGHNQLYLLLSQIWLTAYENQYQLMSNAQVMVAKVVWDTVVYWTFPGLLYFQEKLPRLGESPMATANLLRCWKVHDRVQKFFREWHEIDNPTASDQFADPYSLLPFILDLHSEMAAELTDDELEAKLSENASLLEYLFGQMVTTVLDRVAEFGDDPKVAARVAEWKADPMLDDAVQTFRDGIETEVDSRWITLGHEGPSEILEGAR